MPSKNRYTVSTDPTRFDLALIHRFLRSSYWAKSRPRRMIEKSIRHSFCFAIFFEDQQVGFARVITDHAVFAYLADVFVIPEHQGRGAGATLLRAILKHPKLQNIKRWLLATRDAHKFYAQFGFQPLDKPKRYMTILNPQTQRKGKRS